MNVFVRILYSHALRFVPSRKPSKPRYARRYVSCTRSSASDGLRVIRNAAAYRADMYGIASSAKRAWSAMETRVPGGANRARPRAHAVLVAQGLGSGAIDTLARRGTGCGLGTGSTDRLPFAQSGFG